MFFFLLRFPRDFSLAFLFAGRCIGERRPREASLIRFMLRHLVIVAYPRGIRKVKALEICLNIYCSSCLAISDPSASKATKTNARRFAHETKLSHEKQNLHNKKFVRLFNTQSRLTSTRR